MVLKPQISLFGIPIYSGYKKDLLTVLREHISAKQASFITLFTPNPEQIMLAEKDERFLQTLSKGDITIPDGIGVVWAGKVLFGNNGPKERIAGREVVEDILTIANEQKQHIFVLGGREETNRKLHAYLRRRYLQGIYSIESGYADITHITSSEEDAVLEEIAKKKPDILFVAFGAPYQEKWIRDHSSFLEKTHVRLAMAVGGSFDILVGNTLRAPHIFVTFGLEWLWRLIQQPWRLKRQLQLPKFVFKVLKYKNAT